MFGPASRPLAAVVLALLVEGCGAQRAESLPATPGVSPVASAEAPKPTAEAPTPTADAPTPSADAPMSTPRTALSTGGLELDYWVESSITGRIAAAAVDGDRVVVVGSTTDRHVAWTSSDGTAWNAIHVPPAEGLIEEPELADNFALAGGSMGRLVRLGDTLYSFGTFGFMDFFRPIGWRWTDGQAWQFIDSDSDFFGSGHVADVVATDGSLVAVRQEVSLSWSGADSTTWTWTPETSWVQSDFSASEAERVYLSQVAWNGEGLMASGLIIVPGTEEPVGAPIGVWSSTDGATWTSVEPPEGAIAICALDANPAGRFTALGIGSNGISAWRFSDGAWDETVLSDAPPDAAPTGGPQPYGCRLVVLDAGILAAAVRNDGAVEAWSSADGSTWAFAGVIAQGPASIVGAGDRVVVISDGPMTDVDSTATVRVGRVTASP